jgi:hypothetical protein
MDYQNDDISFVMYRKWKMWIQNNVKKKRNTPLSNNEFKNKMHWNFLNTIKFH